MKKRFFSVCNIFLLHIFAQHSGGNLFKSHTFPRCALHLCFSHHTHNELKSIIRSILIFLNLYFVWYNWYISLKYSYYNMGKDMMLIQIRFQPYTHSLLSRAEVKRKTFQGQKELFSGNNSFSAINLLLYGLFLQLRNFLGGFHEDFYPLIYHSQRPKLSIKHLIGPKVITLIDCKVHLHKIHREHMKI